MFPSPNIPVFATGQLEGSWDCGKPGPAEPSVELMPLELARVSPKRPILENLLRAAPRHFVAE